MCLTSFQTVLPKINFLHTRVHVCAHCDCGPGAPCRPIAHVSRALGNFLPGRSLSVTPSTRADPRGWFVDSRVFVLLEPLECQVVVSLVSSWGALSSVATLQPSLFLSLVNQTEGRSTFTSFVEWNVVSQGLLVVSKPWFFLLFSWPNWHQYKQVWIIMKKPCVGRQPFGNGHTLENLWLPPYFWAGFVHIRAGFDPDLT